MVMHLALQSPEMLLYSAGTAHAVACSFGLNCCLDQVWRSNVILPLQICNLAKQS